MEVGFNGVEAINEAKQYLQCDLRFTILQLVLPLGKLKINKKSEIIV